MNGEEETGEVADSKHVGDLVADCKVMVMVMADLGVEARLIQAVDLQLVGRLLRQRDGRMIGGRKAVSSRLREGLELREDAENESTVLAESGAGAYCLVDDAAGEASSSEVEHDVGGVIGEGGVHNPADRDKTGCAVLGSNRSTGARGEAAARTSRALPVLATDPM